ncbi:MAG: hypothetical protein IT430_04255 [Phycisphaerales bacterium]|nr:hypothetical protein [Phycisphaerales bacterium]
MLHPVPDSAVRKNMLRIVVLQRRLVRQLCALPEGSTIDLQWLENVAWPNADHDWIQRFWTNDGGQRQALLGTIASADQGPKQEFLAVMREQHAFRHCYTENAAVRLRKTDRSYWTQSPVHEAIKRLMLAFDDPWLNKSLGYPASIQGAPEKLTKELYVRTPRARVCPYCDGELQSIEVDHFLPKSAFPFLSVHPDNLVPSCHESNKGDHKGDKVPLDWDEEDQTSQWFHPRLRTASNRFVVDFVEKTDRTLGIGLSAIEAAEAKRVENLDGLFRLSEYWGAAIMDDIQTIQRTVVDSLSAATQAVSASIVIEQFELLAKQESAWIGKRARAIYYSELYRFAAANGAIIEDTLLQLDEDRRRLGIKSAVPPAIN